MTTADTSGAYQGSQTRPAAPGPAGGPGGGGERPAPPAGNPTRAETLIQRVLPNSLEAEACVLGSMIADPNCIDIAVNIVRGEDFFRPGHRLLFETLCRMHAEGDKPIGDLVALKEEFIRTKLLERVGGDDYLAALVEGVPSTANAEYYARLVRDKAMLRNLINANQLIMQEAYESQEDPSEIVDRAEHTIFQIASRQVGDGAVSLESLLQETFERLQNADGATLTGLGTGFFKLDELTCGLQDGEMIVIAARPSMGKTALACNMAEYIAVDDHKSVLMFSLEMSKEQLAQRFLCSRAKFSSQKLRRGAISPEDWTHLQLAAGDLEKAPVFIDDSAELTVLQLRARARRMKAQHDIRCIFVDYLQLMTPSGGGRNDGRTQQVTDISRGIKALARDLRVPVVVMSQLNRSSEGREGHRPRMSDLRESGAIEQDADVVMLLHREDYYHKGEPDYIPTNITELIVAKQRNGPTDMVSLVFMGESIRFENYSNA